MSELVAYGAGEAYQARLRTSQRRLLAAQLRLRRAAALAGALIGLLGNLAMLAALVLTIPLVRAGRLPGWDLAVVALVALAAFEAAVPLPQSFQALGQCLAAGRRIFDLANPPDQADERQTGALAQNSLIEVKGLTVRYPGTKAAALEDVDLTLAPGRHVAVVGANGAGKTTLIGALTGFVPLSGCSVRLGGVPITEISRQDLWAQSAVISQDTWLFNVSLKENVRLGRPDATDEDVRAALEAVRLGPLLASLPDGMDTVVGEQGMRLSGGERQRVAIARAMLKDAPVLLLDEPTEGLDAVTEEGVLQELLELAKGRTLLLVTHRLVGLETMDEILVMSRGRVVERGTHGELLTAQGLYAHFFRLQSDLLQEA
jgi:ATP-binding cassette subfamily C protein CydC